MQHGLGHGACCAGFDWWQRCGADNSRPYANTPGAVTSECGYATAIYVMHLTGIFVFKNPDTGSAHLECTTTELQLNFTPAPCARRFSHIVI